MHLARPTLACLAALGFTTLAFAANLAPVPIESFFDYGELRQVALSPDGNKIAMLAPSEGRYSLAVLDTTTGQVSVVIRFKEENIDSLFWKGNDRLLFTSTIDGFEEPLLASTDLAGKSVKHILQPRRKHDDLSIFFGALVDDYPSSAGHIVILGYTDESDARNIRPTIDASFQPALYRVNVGTARRASLATLDPDMHNLFLDANGQLRISTLRDGTDLLFRIRQGNDKPWRVIRRFKETDERWDVQNIMADGRTAYLIDRTGNSRGELRALDLTTGELGPVIFAPKEGEINHLILAPKRQRLLGIAYESDRHHVQWLDERWQAIAAALQNQFPGHTVEIPSMSDDEKRFIVRTYSDRDPGQFYLGDLRSAGLKLQFVSAARPAIKPEQMSPVTPVQFQSRDGLTLHGYLTKPGGQADRHTPLLVMPHGGPFGVRDSWGYDPEVQFLANRGYAVLQINYRGSGGYGTEFREAGYLEWGGKMQNDLSDGVAWAVAEGITDPQRVGIIGASYGGYAALAGVTTTPELYQVGINYVGVSDLRLITRWDLQHGHFTRAYYENRVGKDPEFLRARSPVEFVANIRVPTLHAYGKNDPRVEFNNWEVLEKALKKHAKIYEALIEEKEGHGFNKEAARLKFYGAVERFLAKYLPADRPAPDAK